MSSNKKEEPFLYINLDNTRVLLSKKLKPIGEFIKEMKELDAKVIKEREENGGNNEEEDEKGSRDLELTPTKKFKP